MESRKISKEKKENVKIPLTMMPSHNILNDVNSHLTLGTRNKKNEYFHHTILPFKMAARKQGNFQDFHT